MNIGTIGKIAAGVGVAGAATAALVACARPNEGKTTDGVAQDYIRRFDENRDNELNMSFESRRTVENRYQQPIDWNGDGAADYYQEINNDYGMSITPLLQRADQVHGDKNGSATASEIAKVVAEFDVGSQDGKAIAGNNLLERSEIKSFEKNYGEARVSLNR